MLVSRELLSSQSTKKILSSQSKLHELIKGPEGTEETEGADKSELMLKLIEYIKSEIIDPPSFPRLFKQGKFVSRIIAFIWLWIDEKDQSSESYKEAAEVLRECFISPNSNCNSEKSLLALFSAKPNSGGKDGSIEKALAMVFPNDKPSKFPIFNEKEQAYYEFVMDTNNFQGVIEDANANHPKSMILTTPFPPRPELGEATVSKDELKTWIDDKNECNPIADNPYIPTCTS